MEPDFKRTWNVLETGCSYGANGRRRVSCLIEVCGI